VHDAETATELQSVSEAWMAVCSVVLKDGVCLMVQQADACPWARRMMSDMPQALG
jgi:hypothetical protein